MRSSFLIGLGALKGNPLRTVLSTLGVIIGVASLVAILSVSDGLEQFSREQIERTTDLQTIQVSPITSDNLEGVRIRREHAPAVTAADIDSLNSELLNAAHATLVLHGSAWMTIPHDTTRVPTLLVATLPNAPSALSLVLSEGRWLSGLRSSSDTNSVVLSRGAAARILQQQPTATILGRPVEILGQPMTVIGVLDGPEAETAARAYLLLRPDSERLLGSGDRRAPNVIVNVERVEEGELVRQRLERWLAGRYGPVDNNFVVSSSRQRIAQVAQAMLVFKLVMGAIAGISLIVGGIGIMNILLASVSERTREIGIRRAAGARASDILLQFLAESVAITGVGSLIGVIVGMVGSLAVTAAIRSFTSAPLHAAFAWSSILVAVGAAVLVGITFGLYPARRASKLDPAEAIRYE